jgi:small GTP-binding protein
MAPADQRAAVADATEHLPGATPPAPAAAQQLAQIVDEPLELVDGFVPASARRDLEAGRERLERERINVVVLGEFKRGKSTLVNALVDTDVVPTGVLPLTAVVTVVRAGEPPRLLVRFMDDERDEIALSQIANFATEAGNPHNRRRVQLLTAEIPSPLLAHGLQLVDTPGIGSVYTHNTETALGFLGQVDAALFVLAADQPLSEAEQQLVRDAAARIPTILFALNKIDHVDQSERHDTTSFTRDRLREAIGAEPELYPLSARTGDGLGSLRARLERLAYRERHDVLDRSVRAHARTFAAKAVQAVLFEAHAVELPLGELERSLERFRERARDLARAREEAAELLEQAAERLIEELVNEPLLTLTRREGPRLCDELRMYVGEQRKIRPRILARRLDGWIERTIRERFEQLADEYERRLAADLAELDARYAERIDAILMDIETTADDVFGKRSGRRAPEVEMRRPSRFTFKLHDLEREMLDQLASLAAASAPGPFGRRLVARQAEARLLMLLDRHAGRLRSDLAERIRTSIRDYERDLGFVVGEAIASVEGAVERATREQRSGRLRVSARLDELQRVEGRIRELETTLQQVV